MAQTLPRVGTRASVRAARIRACKRALDITVALAALLLLSPVLLVTWLLVRLSGSGDAVFRQPRVGRDGVLFVLYKFRTMHADAPDDVHREYVRRSLAADRPAAYGTRGLYKLANDPRITRVGALLRRTSIDELPQLVNVLRGDMSLVGPRPALPYEVEMFGPDYAARFRVPPGLTGLWQVSGRNRLTMRQGLELDLEYVRRHGLLLDLTILLRTVPAVLRIGSAR
jgi:lipopolysaccharide/colanic/teichoic acid biosynthesis glycosyltransferase